MASFNKVILIGNLTRDPRVGSNPSGSAVCDFSIAINRKYSINGQEKEEVCFVDIVTWGKQADSCGKYLQKGSPVFVEGRLKSESWSDKEGNKRARILLTVTILRTIIPHRKHQGRTSAGRKHQRPSKGSNRNRQCRFRRRIYLLIMPNTKMTFLFE